MMRITRHATPEGFWSVAGEHLSQQEARHNLIIGVCHTLIQRSDASERNDYWVTLEIEGEIIGAAMNTPPFNLDIGHITGDALTRTAALQALAADRLQFGDGPPGVTGEIETADEFANIWLERTGQNYQVDMKQRIYQLSHVTHPESVPGQMRVAAEGDRSLLVDWIVSFESEALDHKVDDTEPIHKMLDNIFKSPVRRLYIWEVDQQPVTMTARTGPTPRGMRVNLVYTPPEHRRNGYASALVAGVSQTILDEGRQFCFLYTDLSNPTSNHIYVDVGYEPVCDIDLLKFFDD